MASTGYNKSFPKFTDVIVSNVSINASGDNTIVAAVAGQSIRIIKLFLAGATSVVAKIYDGPSATGTLKGTFTLGTLAQDREQDPLILTAGNALVINLSSGVAVTGQLDYVQD